MVVFRGFKTGRLKMNRGVSEISSLTGIFKRFLINKVK
jgi:hypothetical protein